MRLMLLFISFVFTEILPLVILYEKIDNPNALHTNIYLITKLVDDYNDLLKNMNLQISLEGVYDYSTFSSMSTYSDLIRFAGLDDIQGRLNVLKKHTKNIVMLVGSVDNIDFQGYYEMDPCKSRVFLNILTEPEIFSAVADGIRKWISDLLENEILDPKMGHENKRIYLKQEILQKFRHCRAENQNIKEIKGVDMGVIKTETNKEKNNTNKQINIETTSNNNLITNGHTGTKRLLSIENKLNKPILQNQQFNILKNTKTFPEDNLELEKIENPIFYKGFPRNGNDVIPYGNTKPKNAFFHTYSRNYILSPENNI